MTTPCLRFAAGGLDHPQVQQLLSDHLQSAAALSPPDSVHALDASGLTAPGCQFWSVWSGEHLVGMCALLTLDVRHGEIKSMRTASRWLKQGIGDAMMRHILATARAAGLHRISLETGSEPAYAPARRLYARHGFQVCKPFADYREDPLSCYMTRWVESLDESPT